ncbi:hypothetical protein GOODEAATRI_021755, partial [Goodea atripinnis]
LGGAVGYMLGGLDWTGTALGRAFKSQEQVLFLFAGVIFIISVTLHMLSIPERTCASPNQVKDGEGEETSSQLSVKLVGCTRPSLNAIAEEDAFALASSQEEKESHLEEGEIDFLAVDRVWSKSDSVLAMPDATIELDSDLHLDREVFLPEVHFLPEDLDNGFKPLDTGLESSSPPDDRTTLTDGTVVLEPTNTHVPQIKDPTNGQPSFPQTSSASENAHPSFTFSYYGRVGLQRYRLRRTRPASPRPITTSRSLTDLRDILHHVHRRKRQPSVSSLSSEGSSSDGETERGTTVYISQILVASALGSVVKAVGSVRVIPVVASGGSFLGFLTACFLVIYPDPEPSSSEQDQDSDALPGEEDQKGEETSNHRLALLNLTDKTREDSAT